MKLKVSKRFDVLSLNKRASEIRKQAAKEEGRIEIFELLNSGQ
jgi:hypothetical protein